MPDNLAVLQLPDQQMTCHERRGFRSIGYNETLAGKTMKDFPDISRTLVTADCRNQNQAIRSMDDIDITRHEQPLPEYYWPSNRPRPRNYYAGFLDGHVELVQSGTRIDFGTPATPQVPPL